VSRTTEPMPVPGSYALITPCTGLDGSVAEP
jgi:hypothetical protein